MKSFQSVRKLDVFRRLSNGERAHVGVLAQNAQGVFFQYDREFLAHFSNLSPFSLDFNDSLQRAPKTPHEGLHGVFADSLPDGWGRLLMDRAARQHGILPSQLTAMDRLSWIGARGMGALEYEPVAVDAPAANNEQTDVAVLAEQAIAVFDGQTEDVLTALAAAGSPGGARPKVQIFLRENDLRTASTAAQNGFNPWLVKFTSRTLSLGHEESLCEAAYFRMCERAGISVPTWQLIPAPASSGAIAWLALKRFDCTSNTGRFHLHSLGGLVDADFRLPSLDYENVIKAGQALCREPAVGRQLFRRAVFNLFACNQDDHARNWAFLQDDSGRWQPSPAYDVTFSPAPHGEHATAYLGHGKAVPRKAMEKLAQQANFSHWNEAKPVIDSVVAAISDWDAVAAELGVSAGTRRLVKKQLDTVYALNRELP